jgi:hypothetical protein
VGGNTLKKLNLDTARNCFKNIWLLLLAVFVLMGVNFNSMVMPYWLLRLLAVNMLVYSFLSFSGYLYWVSRSWLTYSMDTRLGKFFLMLFGLLLEAITFYILFKLIAFSLV